MIMEKSEQQAFRFREEAMATHFEILIAHEDHSFAKSLANLCFREIDRLEELLSRFNEGSDIARINTLQEGETILISEECHQCLRQAFEIHLITDGLFDIATGGFMNLIRDKEGQALQSSEGDWEQARLKRKEGKLTLHNDRAAITCKSEGLILDVGGIGKGFTLDRLSELLMEMDAPNFLLSAGGSTLLSKGKTVDRSSWMANFHSDQEPFSMDLNDESLSASGYAVKGAHLMNRGKVNDPGGSKRVWVKAQSAALSDALSTTCLMLDTPSIVTLAESLNTGMNVWKETSKGIVKIV